MKKISLSSIILVTSIFIGGFIKPVNAAPPFPPPTPDATYLRLNGTNQSSWTPTTSLVANLNADLWDGYQFATYLDQPVKTTSSPTFMGLTTPFIKPSFDSTTAVQIRKADGTTSVLNIDTANGRLGIGTISPVYPLDCDGDINTSTVYRIGGSAVLRSIGDNLFVGISSGYSNTTGYRNTFLGAGSGYHNTTGTENIFVGWGCGRLNTEGANNTFVGDIAGESNTTGGSNTFVGGSSGSSNTTGYENTFLGRLSGRFNSTGNNNTFVGTGSGYSNTTGITNTCIGQYSGGGNTTGSANVYLGYLVSGNPGTISSSIGIGVATAVTANNQLVVGSANPYGLITDSYWGSGVTKVNPSAFTFNASGGEGTDNAGADLKIAGGKGTGAANGGKIIFQTAPAGPLGVTPNTLVDRITITSDGNVVIGTQTPTALLDLNGTTGYDQLRMRTSYTPVGTAATNGNAGDIAWDDDYIYIKTSMGWKRAALNTW